MELKFSVQNNPLSGVILILLWELFKLFRGSYFKPNIGVSFTPNVELFLLLVELFKPQNRS